MDIRRKAQKTRPPCGRPPRETLRPFRQRSRRAWRTPVSSALDASTNRLLLIARRAKAFCSGGSFYPPPLNRPPPPPPPCPHHPAAPGRGRRGASLALASLTDLTAYR